MRTRVVSPRFRTRVTSDKGNAHGRVVSFRVRDALMSRSIASGCGVARSVKFQPGLERSYHKRMRIKIGPSACIDCRVENSQTFLWGPPDTGLLARGFAWHGDARGGTSRLSRERWGT